MNAESPAVKPRTFLRAAIAGGLGALVGLALVVGGIVALAVTVDLTWGILLFVPFVYLALGAAAAGGAFAVALLGRFTGVAGARLWPLALLAMVLTAGLSSAVLNYIMRN